MRFLILFGLMIGTSFSSDNIEEFKKKAEQGDAVAQYNLGKAFDKGEGLEKNPVEAVKWFRKSAEQGFAMAQYELGIAYYSDLGVKRNPDEARIWLRKSAEQGYLEAQLQLGIDYFINTGRNKLVNPTEAMKWFRKAAEQGNTNAQLALGNAYDNGYGVKKNPVESLAWYYVAAAFDDSIAKTMIRKSINDDGEKNVSEAIKRSKFLISEIEAFKSAKKTEPIIKPNSFYLNLFHKPQNLLNVVLIFSWLVRLSYFEFLDFNRSPVTNTFC